MKNYRNEILKATATAIAFYALSVITIGLLFICFGGEEYAIWGIMMSPICGALMSAPVIIRQENRVHHFKKMMNKNKGL